MGVQEEGTGVEEEFVMFMSNLEVKNIKKSFNS